MSRSTVKVMSGNAARAGDHHCDLLAADVGADEVGIHPLGHVADEVGRPELEHRLLVAAGHRIAVRAQQGQVLGHARQSVPRRGAGRASTVAR